MGFSAKSPKKTTMLFGHHFVHHFVHQKAFSKKNHRTQPNPHIEKKQLSFQTLAHLFLSPSLSSPQIGDPNPSPPLLLSFPLEPPNWRSKPLPQTRLLQHPRAPNSICPRLPPSSSPSDPPKVKSAVPRGKGEDDFDEDLWLRSKGGWLCKLLGEADISLEMGAPTSLTKWIPQDDFLLKNAVEAGASLESLAKGAVQFSRRFTLRELQDRWRSLLYDLDTSKEASARIVEIEIELAAPNFPKANRACNPNSIGKESSSGKRKADSVRSHYYAMRKRIHSEPHAASLSFLVRPALLADNGCNNGSLDQLKSQSKHPVDNFALEMPCSNDYGHPETGYDSGQHAFPELLRVDSAAPSDSHQLYHTKHVGLAEDEIHDGASHKGCLFGLTDTENNMSVPCNEAECNNGNQSFEHNFQQRDFPHILGENLMSVDNSSDVHEISQTNALGTSSPYENDGIGARPPSDFDSSNTNHEGVCSDFVGNNNLISHVPDCSCPFNQFGYSNSSSDMPIWRTMEDISRPTIPMDGHYRDMDDHKTIDAPGCDGTSSQPKLDDGKSGAVLNNPAIMPGNDFMDFSDTYMDFADEDLFIDVDDKDNTDRSGLGLSSILLSSPSGTHGVANSSDLGATDVLETCLEIPDAACSGEPNLLDQMHSVLHNDRNTNVSGIDMPSSSSQTSKTASPQQEFMICVLNTEDVEIPNNDHINFPEQAYRPFFSNLEQCSREGGLVLGLLAVNVFTDGRAPVGDPNKVKEEAINVQSTVSALEESSSSFPKVGVLHSCDGRTVEAESSKIDSIAEVSRHAGSCVDEAKPCKSETVSLNSIPVAALKEENMDLTFQDPDNHDTSFVSFLENHLQESVDAKVHPLNADEAKIHPLNATDSYPEEANMQVAVPTCLPYHSDMASAEAGFSDTVAIKSASNQEEHCSDSDDDVPYFSDIEALILDMDLGPYDEESCLLSKEVSRYQHMDTKNTIRWEQGFRSHINRSIVSHGAFAIFYGRHLKYFIKDPEVSIGRETRDAKVDIDLGREGRANKISRLQAIIKMDEEGAFSLKNTGKFSIFVNGRELPAKSRINLLSHSLVKIQDMQFAFEVNESAVRHHIEKLRRSSQEQSTFRFDWKTEQNP